MELEGLIFKMEVLMMPMSLYLINSEVTGKTLVYPAHDYNGKKFSTIKNEKITILDYR